MYDLNNADENFDLIPPGIYRVNAKLRLGGVGDERPCKFVAEIINEKPQPQLELTS
jgi:hypothetical protein